MFQFFDTSFEASMPKVTCWGWLIMVGYFQPDLTGIYDVANS